MTALRISMRYNNIDFLFRYGFKLEKLKNYALKCYKENPTGQYIKECNSDLFPEEIAQKMTKILLVLESKLVVSCLKEASSTEGDIDYTQYLKHYSELLKLIPTNIPEDKKTWDTFLKENPLYKDCYFPTIDPSSTRKINR